MKKTSAERKSQIPTFRRWAKNTKRFLGRKAGPLLLAGGLTIPAAFAGTIAGREAYQKTRQTNAQFFESNAKTRANERTTAYRKHQLFHLVKVLNPNEREILQRILDEKLRYPELTSQTFVLTFHWTPEELRAKLTKNDLAFFDGLIQKYGFEKESRRFANAYLEAFEQSEKERNRKRLVQATLGDATNAAILAEKRAIVVTLFAWGLLTVFARLRERKFLLSKTTTKSRPYDLNEVKERFEALNEKLSTNEKLSRLEQHELKWLKRIIAFEMLGELPEREKEILRKEKWWKR